MAKILITLSDFEDSIVTVAKAHYGVGSKSAAVKEIICDASDDFLALRPEFIERLRNAEKGPKLRFKNAEELRKYLGKEYESSRANGGDVLHRGKSRTIARSRAPAQKKSAYA